MSVIPPKSPDSEVGKFLCHALRQMIPLASELPGLDGVTNEEAAHFLQHLTQP